MTLCCQNCARWSPIEPEENPFRQKDEVGLIYFYDADTRKWVNNPDVQKWGFCSLFEENGSVSAKVLTLYAQNWAIITRPNFYCAEWDELFEFEGAKVCL